jgi:hypothetical protein
MDMAMAPRLTHNKKSAGRATGALIVLKPLFNG